MGYRYEFADWFVISLIHAFLATIMGNTFIKIDTFNDHHKEVTINGVSNAAEIVRNFMADDVEPVKDEEPAPAEKPYTPPIPREGDYNGVRLYIEERKKYDQDFKTFCQNHNRKDLCSFLTKQFGWFVDDNSLCQNIRRNM